MSINRVDSFKAVSSSEMSEEISDLLAINYLQACILNFYVNYLSNYGSNVNDTFYELGILPESLDGQRVISDLIFNQLSIDLIQNPHFIKACRFLGVAWRSDYVFSIINKNAKIANISLDVVQRASQAGQYIINYGYDQPQPSFESKF